MVTVAVVVRTTAHHALVGGEATSDVFGPTTAHVVMLTVATVLSTFKPGGRTPWAPRSIERSTPQPERSAA
jgi:hypothetical protein